jgi:hypothetical protein
MANDPSQPDPKEQPAADAAPAPTPGTDAGKPAAESFKGKHWTAVYGGMTPQEIREMERLAERDRRARKRRR